MITGAAGRIASFYRAHLLEKAERDGQPSWRLRLVDRGEIPNAAPTDEVCSGADDGDLTRPEVARRVVEGAFAVLHLAGNRKPNAEFYDALLENNVKATFNVLEAACIAGVSRVVYSSSIHAVLGYPAGRQARAEDPPRPRNVYGASKAWGEALCSAFVERSGGKLSAIAVRIGWAIHREPLPPQVPPQSCITLQDLSSLLDCCWAARGISYAVVNGLSNNREISMDLDTTRRLVGYEPKDDAFALGRRSA